MSEKNGILVWEFDIAQELSFVYTTLLNLMFRHTFQIIHVPSKQCPPTLRLMPSLFRITTCLFPPFGHIILLARVRDPRGFSNVMFSTCNKTNNQNKISKFTYVSMWYVQVNYPFLEDVTKATSTTSVPTLTTIYTTTQHVVCTKEYQ